MAYCPSCGTEIQPEAQYCHSCGTELDGMSATTTEEDTSHTATDANGVRTATVKTEDEDRHYNVDNIAYIRDTTSKLSLVGWIIVVLAAGVAVTVLVVAAQEAGSSLPYQVLFFGIVGAILYFLKSTDGIDIGTVTGADKYKGEGARQLVREITAKADNAISLSGEYRSTTRIRAYRYHFFPKNIVQINKSSKSNLGVALFVGILAVLVGGATALSDEPVFGIFITVLGLLIALFVYEKTDLIEVDLQGGQRKKFAMDPAHAEQVIAEFASSPTPHQPGSTSTQPEATTRGGTDSGSSSVDPTVGQSARSSAKEYEIKTRERATGERVTVCGGCGAEVDEDAEICSACKCNLTSGV